ncbi:MAG TPA: 6-phosphogluconolactonase [Propionibacterium sp.]|jgi:6-phosphogluconolactonase|nr:6-phosphogluconolactonase [Propionibacterium sp.]
MHVVVTCRDRTSLVRTVARRLEVFLTGLQAERQSAVQVCLAGGRVAGEIYRQVSIDEIYRHVSTNAPVGIDWSRLELWWGDERFVPLGSPERNAGQILSVLASAIPLDRALIHPMPSSSGQSADIRRAAQHYAEELGDTTFDLCLLGMGEDGHVASLFPGHPDFDPRTTKRVVAVGDAPKPPPDRLSLTLPVLNSSGEIWMLVAGADKAEAVSRAIARDKSLPAGQVCGRNRTVWFLDEEAAAELG